MRWLGKIIDRCCAVLGALVLMQLPLFMLQYQHQLHGHVAELVWYNTKIEEQAAKNNKNLETYLQKFQQSLDPEIAAQGHFMQKMQLRLEKLSHAEKKLQEASTLTRPWVFLMYCESEILISTFHFFQPGLSLNYETLCYALFGVLLGYLLFHFTAKILHKIYKRISRRQILS